MNVNLRSYVCKCVRTYMCCYVRIMKNSYTVAFQKKGTYE